MPQQHRDDPYLNFNFRVEIAGLAAASCSAVSGLESEVEVVEYREGGEELRVRKLPGLHKYGNIVLKRGITQTLDWWTWHKQVLDGNVQRRTGEEQHSPATLYPQPDSRYLPNKLSP